LLKNKWSSNTRKADTASKVNGGFSTKKQFEQKAISSYWNNDTKEIERVHNESKSQ